MEEERKLDKNEIDEITIFYDFKKSREIEIDDKFREKVKNNLGETISFQKLFGEKFVENNKNICKIIINNEKKDLCSYIENYEKYLIEDILVIKLIGIKNIIDSSYMFSGCLSLISLPDISKWDISNIKNIRGMFFYCSSLKYIDDISKWRTNKITDLCGVFQYCSSLISLPDISQWNTENVTNMNSIFENCINLK